MSMMQFIMAASASSGPSIPIDINVMVDGHSMEANENGTALAGGSTPSPGFWYTNMWQFEKVLERNPIAGANFIGFGNEAASGDDLEGQINATELGRISNLIIPGVPNFLIARGGINNLQYGESAAVVYSKLITYHQVAQGLLTEELVAQGTTLETIAVTETATQAVGGAGTGGVNASIDTQRLLLNGMIRAGFQTDLNTNWLFDIDSITPLSGLTKVSNPVWYRADLIHPSLNYFRIVGGMLWKKGFAEYVIPNIPGIVTLPAIDTTNPIVSTDYHDSNNSKFTYSGDWSLTGGNAPSGSGLGSDWRNGDATFYSSNNLPATVSWTTETFGQIDEGVDIFLELDDATKGATLTIDEEEPVNLCKTFPTRNLPPALMYPIRGLGAGVHTFSLVLHGGHFFDGITEHQRTP